MFTNGAGAFAQDNADRDESKWIVLKSDGSVLSDGIGVDNLPAFVRAQARAADPAQDATLTLQPPPPGGAISRPDVIVIRPEGPNAVLTDSTNRLLNDIPLGNSANSEIETLNRTLLFEWFLDNANALSANNPNAIFFLNMGATQRTKSRAEIEIDRANYLRLLDRLDQTNGRNVLIVPSLP